MSYVAIKGGAEAIDGAARANDFLRVCAAARGETPLTLPQIEHQLHYLSSQVLSEGGLYDPELAALAIKQALGDPLEAAFFLRAYRSTRPRLHEISPTLDSSQMRLIRRVSAAFKDVPGGQFLGPTPDYTQRLFDLELIDETEEAFRRLLHDWEIDLPAGDDLPTSAPKVIAMLRAKGLLAEPPPAAGPPEEPFDITREPLVSPVPRSAALATLSRGHTGSLLALAYSNMRGYGDIHPTVAELRVGYLPVYVKHPSGDRVEAGEVLATECEVVAMFDSESGGPPRFSLGYGACFGHNEVKAISMAILDRALQIGATRGPKNPSEDRDFVLHHVDGVDAMGFCVHYKMPHYVTFQSDLDRLRAAQSAADSDENPLSAASQEGDADGR